MANQSDSIFAIPIINSAAGIVRGDLSAYSTHNDSVGVEDTTRKA